MIASFMARAVVDEVLPPAYMSDQNNSRPGDPVVAKALTLLSREHSTARLEKVWGPGDGRPVEEVKRAMDNLLQEYLESRELDEAARCVKELGAPHFHHELVKRGVVCAMETNGTDVMVQLDAMAALIDFLVRNAIVSDNQVKKGLSRLHTLLPDLQLDVPQAADFLSAFESFLSAAQAVDEDADEAEQEETAAAEETATSEAPAEGSKEE
jgi:programmed cell death protein 4